LVPLLIAGEASPCLIKLQTTSGLYIFIA